MISDITGTATVLGLFMFDNPLLWRIDVGGAMLGCALPAVLALPLSYAIARLATPTPWRERRSGSPQTLSRSGPGHRQLPIKTRMLVAAYAIRTVALCSASPASSGYGHDTQDEAPYEILLQLL